MKEYIYYFFNDAKDAQIYFTKKNTYGSAGP